MLNAYDTVLTFHVVAGIIGLAAGSIWVRHYRRKFREGAQPAAQPARA